MLLSGLTLPGSSGPSVLGVAGSRFLDPEDASGDAVDLAGCVAIPGPIDLHVHGGGGFDVTTSADSLRAAVGFHRGHGTAATLVSLVTAPLDQLCVQLERIADLIEAGANSRTPPPPEAGIVLGAHLEGPFLAHPRCGAQNPAHLLAPDRAVLAELIAAARGTLRVVTVAPELPGALELIDDLRAAGIVVAIGHTDATYAQTLAAIEHGAGLVTHLHNGMRPPHHREPGPPLAAFEHGLLCELINDGVHLHPAVARRARDSTQVTLITDAIDATGAGDGDYLLGGQAVQVRSGQARLAGTGSLAGSTLTLDAAAGRALRDGWTVDQLAEATSGAAARLLGVEHEYGSFAPGRRADALVLNPDGSRRGILAAGRWTPRARRT